MILLSKISLPPYLKHHQVPDLPCIISVTGIIAMQNIHYLSGIQQMLEAAERRDGRLGDLSYLVDDLARAVG